MLINIFLLENTRIQGLQSVHHSFGDPSILRAFRLQLYEMRTFAKCCFVDALFLYLCAYVHSRLSISYFQMEGYTDYGEEVWSSQFGNNIPPGFRFVLVDHHVLEQ